MKSDFSVSREYLVMRSLVSSNRLRCLSQVAFVSILAGISAGCSSDFTRMDRTLYSALPASSNANQNNPYPGNVDPTTTASVNGNPIPIGNVAATNFAIERAPVDAHRWI